MPARPEVSPRFLEEKLKAWEIFNNKGYLKNKKDPVWEEIKYNLNLKMAAKSIYLYVCSDRHNVLSNLKKYFSISGIEQSNEKEEIDLEFGVKNPKHCKDLQFEVEVVTEDFLSLYRDKKGWTDILHSEMWNKEKLPCVFNFKSSYISIENIFTCSGICSDCGSSVDCESDLKKDLKGGGKFLTITVKTFDTHQVPHTKKRKLKGKMRVIVKERLIGKTATEYRENEIGKLGKEEMEPPHLNDTLTLKKAREEAINEDINYLEFKKQSMSSVLFIQVCSIEKISYLPFQILYWTKDQINLWNKLETFNDLQVSFDATGGMVKKYSVYKGIMSKTIFYYVIVVGINNKIIPVMQALLDAHHVSIITEVLEKWIETGARIPPEIVTDGSLALQNAICIAFNKMTFKQYLLNCFKILKKSSNGNTIPRCYYRLDIAHLINTVRHWSCFKHVDKIVTDFYLRCIGYLSGVENLQEFQEIVFSVVVICNSTLSEKGSECYEQTLRMTEIFKTYKHNFNDNIISEDYISKQSKNTEDSDLTMDFTDELIKYIDSIFKEGKLLCSNEEKITDEGNYYFCPGFNESFKKLCYTFVTWTNVARKLFRSKNAVASSSRSETFFSKRKAGHRPMSVPKFILKDVKKIKDFTNMGFQQLQKKKEINS